MIVHDAYGFRQDTQDLECEAGASEAAAGWALMAELDKKFCVACNAYCPDGCEESGLCPECQTKAESVWIVPADEFDEIVQRQMERNAAVIAANDELLARYEIEGRAS